MLNLLKLSGLFPNIRQEGFSAYLSSLETDNDAQLTGWTVTAPYFGSSYFDEASGTYTAPAAGVYSMKATVSYATNSAVSGSLGTGIFPAFLIRRTSSPAADLITGLFPMMNVTSLLNLRAILGCGTVTLSGTVQLSAGDAVGLFYDADEMTLTITIENVVWTVYRLD